MIIFIFFKLLIPTQLSLIGIRYSRHSRHHTQHIVVHGIDTDLSGGSARNGGGREHELEDGIVNAGEVATAGWLVFLRAQSKGVQVDTSIGGAGVVLEGLHHVEVGTLTLREAVLAVELELGSDARVLTPAVHIEGGLGEHEGAGIGDEGAGVVTTLGEGGQGTTAGGPVTLVVGSAGRDRDTGRGVLSTSQVEEARGGDERVGASLGSRGAEGVDGVGESVDRIGVVERLGTQCVEEDGAGGQGRAVVDVGIRLDNPDQLLAGVVEVELNLVAGAADRLIAGKLHLLKEVLVGVLGHLAALVSVQEHVVDVEGGRHQRLLVGEGGRDGGAVSLGEGGHGPQALADGADVEVDLDLVVLYTTLYPSFRNI